MTSVTTKPDSSHPTGETAVYLFDNWFDPIEGGVRDRVREFIHAMIEGELDICARPGSPYPCRPRRQTGRRVRGAPGVCWCRQGRRGDRGAARQAEHC